MTLKLSTAFLLNRYYFDGRGKSVRPRLTAAMSEAVNYEMGLTSSSGDLFQRQQQVRSSSFSIKNNNNNNSNVSLNNSQWENRNFFLDITKYVQTVEECCITKSVGPRITKFLRGC